MQIASKYAPQDVEDKWYQYWMENNYFSSKPNNKKPYTIVIPPPNVTGVLHMGHMLNNTIQDVLIRKARMSGYNACWVPGTDHASIATEAKVVNKLKEDGISKFDIGREQFLEHAWEWTHKHGGIILEQLKKLGASCDWDRTKFTMDEDMSKSVIKMFIDLYNKGLIYRGYRMINWDPEAKTNISDEEVIYKEQNGKLYFLKYKIPNNEIEHDKNISNSIKKIKDELKQIIYGNEFGGTHSSKSQTTISTIYSKLRREKETNPQIEKKQSIKQQEEIILSQLADKSQLWIENINQDKYLDEGAEQKVYDNGLTVLKVNDGIYYESWEDYLISLQIHNLLFPQTAYTLKGFIKKEDKLQIVVEQPFIQQNDNYNFEEIKKFLENIGFKNTKNQDFYHEELGIILEDLHDENVLKYDKIYHFIDDAIYIKKPLNQQEIIVATTRPETIFGDTAVCVNPNDERYKHLIGKTVIVPIVNREVPVIADEYVDMEFGTGALKITPANDINDYELGKKHQIPAIEIFNDDATLNENGMHYQGKDRFIVRKMIAKELEEKGLMKKVEDYQNKVGTSERTGAVIEPKLSVQWYLKMSELAKPALDVVMNEELKFYPQNYKNTYRHWMENITDWNISRQLWWGHQIPVYYFGDGQDDFVVAENIDDALKLAQEKSGKLELTIDDLKQDPDVLDTWFSSWLWPISVFNGVLEPNNEEINYYYPTNDLVTGPDIIFFWVARMIMAGYDLREEKPFKNVYFTGIVRDKQGRKMSKQLGNSPDPLELIQQYGADGVRVGILMSSAAGNDLKFDEALCLQGRNFANKIWNAFRLIKGWEPNPAIKENWADRQAIDWMNNRINQVLFEIEDHFSKYRISDALLVIYKLIWDDFCAWYLEIIKPNPQEMLKQVQHDNRMGEVSLEVYIQTVEILEKLLKMLHPFMPFITEEIWQQITPRSEREALIISDFPKAQPFEEEIIKEFDISKEIVSAIRNYRQSKGISPKEAVELWTTEPQIKNLEVVQKLGNISDLYLERKPEGNNFQFLIGTKEFFIPQAENQMSEEEITKIKEEIVYLEGFLKSVMAKLNNEKFVAHAKPEVVENERKKQRDAEEKLTSLRNSIK